MQQTNIGRCVRCVVGFGKFDQQKGNFFLFSSWLYWMCISVYICEHTFSLPSICGVSVYTHICDWMAVNIYNIYWVKRETCKNADIRFLVFVLLYCGYSGETKYICICKENRIIYNRFGVFSRKGKQSYICMYIHIDERKKHFLLSGAQKIYLF